MINIIEKRDFEISYDKAKWTDLEGNLFAVLSQKDQIKFTLTSYRFIDDLLVAKAHIKGFPNQEYYLNLGALSDKLQALTFLKSTPEIDSIIPIDFCEPDFESEIWNPLTTEVPVLVKGSYIPAQKTREEIALIATDYTFSNGKLITKAHIQGYPEIPYIARWYTQEFEESLIPEFLAAYPTANSYYPTKFTYKKPSLH